MPPFYINIYRNLTAQPSVVSEVKILLTSSKLDLILTIKSKPFKENYHELPEGETIVWPCRRYMVHSSALFKVFPLSHWIAAKLQTMSQWCLWLMEPGPHISTRSTRNSPQTTLTKLYHKTRNAGLQLLSLNRVVVRFNLLSLLSAVWAQLYSRVCISISPTVK